MFNLKDKKMNFCKTLIFRRMYRAAERLEWVKDVIKTIDEAIVSTDEPDLKEQFIAARAKMGVKLTTAHLEYEEARDHVFEFIDKSELDTQARIWLDVQACKAV